MSRGAIIWCKNVIIAVLGVEKCFNKVTKTYFEYFMRETNCTVLINICQTRVFLGELYWSVIGRTVQPIMTWFQQRKTGCTSWTKSSRLQSQMWVTIFASFRQGRPWRQNRTLSLFFVIVTLSMQHYVQADLLSHTNFINVGFGSSSWQCRHTWKEK